MREAIVGTRDEHEVLGHREHSCNSVDRHGIEGTVNQNLRESMQRERERENESMSQGERESQ